MTKKKTPEHIKIRRLLKRIYVQYKGRPELEKFRPFEDSVTNKTYTSEEWHALIPRMRTLELEYKLSKQLKNKNIIEPKKIKI